MTAASPLSRRLTPWLAPWLALSGLALLAYLVLTPFLVPLVWAGVLAYASWPLAEWIRARCGGRDTLAALTLFAPLLWLAWVAQQEVGVLGGLLAFGLVGLFAGPIAGIAGDKTNTIVFPVPGKFMDFLTRGKAPRKVA